MSARAWFERGFSEIVSVIPPDGKIAKHSDISPSAKGKAPAIPFGKDEWEGYDFTVVQATPYDVDLWTKKGANVGLRSRFFPGIDIDVDNFNLVGGIRDLVLQHLGPAPQRVGKEPRVLLPYRIQDPFPKKTLKFYHYQDLQKVEILGNGQQYVVYGQHPTNGAYKWKTPEPQTPDELTEVTEDQIWNFLNDVLGPWLEEQNGVSHVELSGGYRSSNLQRDISELVTDKQDRLREAMAYIPNSKEEFPERDNVIAIAHALYGATYENSLFGRDLFLEFMSRSWRADAAHTDWGAVYDKLKTPRIGAEVIFRRAHRFGFDLSSVVFSPVELVEKPPPSLPNRCMKYTDAWTAHRFLDEFGDTIRYVPAWKEFIVREENLWMLDKWCRVPDAIRDFCESMGPDIIADLGAEDGANVVARFQSDRNMSSLQRMLMRHRTLVVQPEEFDSNPHVLNTPSGLYDLRSGKEMPFDPTQINLRQTSIVPDWTCPIPLFREFLMFITNDDLEMIDLLQRLAGYAITGNSTDQIFFFAYGTGGNGKGMFIRLLQSVLGDYAATVNSKVFCKRGREPHLAELLPFQGRRLITAQEFESDAVWDESRIKLLTGDDSIVVEKKHGDPFEFNPTHTLLLAGNSIPTIPDLDEGVRRRMRLLPFKRVVPEELKDEKREEQIRVNELPGVLAWLMDGAKLWYQKGLGEMPSSVLLETESYFTESDDIQLWLDECCIQPKDNENPDDFKTSTRDLYESIQLFLLQRGASQLSQRAFSMRIQRRGFEMYRSSSERGFKGIRLIEVGSPSVRMTA